MKNVPVWIDTARIRKFPKLQRNINVDLLVVGGGVTGITTAYLLTLEDLVMGVTERKLMWQRLAVTKFLRLNSYDSRDLHREVERQIDRIDAEPTRAVSESFAGVIDSK